jgi:hypothetical protein
MNEFRYERKTYLKAQTHDKLNHNLGLIEVLIALKLEILSVPRNFQYKLLYF